MDTEEVLAGRRRDRSGMDTSDADPKKHNAETAPDSAEGGSTEDGSAQKTHTETTMLDGHGLVNATHSNPMSTESAAMLANQSMPNQPKSMPKSSGMSPVKSGKGEGGAAQLPLRASLVASPHFFRRAHRRGGLRRAQCKAHVLHQAPPLSCYVGGRFGTCFACLP
eukprot:2203976-Prymnesium_polylepis.1